MIGLRRHAQDARPPYKLLSVLLQYPDGPILAAEDEILRAARDLPPSGQKEVIARFLSGWAGTSPGERAARYVKTFDLQRRCSLHLTFYLQGDRRQRGTALLRLKRLYAAAGLLLEGGELPDYLPVLLEFAALDPDRGETLLRESRPALEVLRAGLRETGSPYRFLLDAICLGLPRLSPLEAERVAQLIADGPPDERVGLEPFAPPEVMPERIGHR